MKTTMFLSWKTLPFLLLSFMTDETFSSSCYPGYIFNGTVCEDCFKRDGIYVLSIATPGGCKPLLLDRVLEAFCDGCEDYDNVIYEWTLGKRFPSDDPTCILFKDVVNVQVGKTANYTCEQLDCDDILNGYNTSGEKLDLALRVTVWNNGDATGIVGSISEGVYMTKTMMPGPGPALCYIQWYIIKFDFPVQFIINCTELHETFDMLNNTAGFYADNVHKFRKEVQFQLVENFAFTFIEPISGIFVPPPGTPTGVYNYVYDCDTMVSSNQWFPHVTGNLSDIDSNFSIVYNSAEFLKDPDGFLLYEEMRLAVVSKVKESVSNISTIEDMTTMTEVMNIITERADWINDIDKKTSTVDIYSGLSKTFEELGDSIPADEMVNKSGFLLQGVTTTLDRFIDVTNETIENSTDMSVLVNKLMDSIDTVCGSSLKKLPITEEPTILYSTPATKLFVQNTNNSGLGGTKLNMDSQNTTLEFPDDFEVDAASKVGLQMIYQKNNPFVFENPTQNVTVPILTVTLRDPTGQKIKVEGLQKPVKYFTPRTGGPVLDIGQINVTYTKNTTNNVSTEDKTNHMLHIKLSFKKGETKVVTILLPTNISNIWLYGQAITPPAYQTVINKGFLYPLQWREMQASYGNGFYNDTLGSNTSSTDHAVYVPADDSLFGTNSSYDMYFGMTLDLEDDGLVELLNTSFAECRNSTEGNCSAEVHLSFSMVVDSLFCLFWDTDTRDWSTQGCQAYPNNDTSLVECHCNHLSSLSSSSFASEFFVAPVMISLDDVMLFSTFFDNPVVVTVIVVVWIVYFFTVHWARRFDKKDIEQVGVLNCEDNTPTETYLYLICVMTGWWNQAGTTANVYMSITGKSNTSSKKRLSTTARVCFQKGFEDWFLFSTEKTLGTLQTVTIWHDNAGTSPHWYLNQVYIKDLQSRMVWNFIYNDWLAVDRGDLRQTTTTIQAVTEEDMKFKQKYNFAVISSRNLREGHLWVSIVSKPPQSSFTRVQRLTCGLSLLLTMMLTNIMFYGLPPDNPDDQLEAGGFSFNIRQFIIGIESSIIMFPVNFIVLQLFLRVEPKPPKQRKITVNNKGRKDTGPTYKQRLSWFYRKLYRSGTFKHDVMFQKMCMLFTKDSLDSVGDLLVAKYLQTCTRNILFKTMNSGSETQNVNNNAECLFSNVLHSKDKVNWKMQGKCSTALQSLPIGFREDEINWNMSNVSGKVKQRESINHMDSDPSTKSEPLVKKKGVKKVLPWWFIYISWTIVMGSCLTCSFFVMLYGLKYGYARSVEWIVSFMTGFLQGVFLEQPLKVIGVAIVLALVLHKQADIEEFGPDLELAEDEEYVSDVKIEGYKHQPFVEPISDSLLTRIKDRLRIEWLMDVTIRDLILYLLYLTVVLVMVHGHNNHHTSYLNSQTIYQLLVEPTDGASLLEVTSPEEFYSYMQETFIPMAESLAETERNETLGTPNHYLLGFYRLRQVRTKPVDCAPALPVKLASRCICDYSLGDEDTGSYTDSWANVTGYKGLGPWTYHDSWDLKTLPYPGTHATYSGGGYIQMLKTNASDKVTTLEEKGWIDEHTRAVFVECTLYNPNVDIFTLVVILLEMTPVGIMYPRYEILSTKLHHYSSDGQKVIAACEGLFVCFNLLFIIIECQKVRKLGKKEYFSDSWRVFELLQIALSFVVVGVFVKRILTVTHTIEQLSDTNNDEKFINFYEAFFWNSVLEYIMAFLVAISISKAIKLTRFNTRMKIINATIAKVRPDLFGFFFFFMIVSMAFTHCSYLFFGRVLGLYKSVHHSLYQNILIIIGAEIGLDLQDVHGIFGPVYMISYVLGMCFICVQVLVTIINAGRIVTKFELAGNNQFELMDYMMNKVKMVMSRK